jgi:hypothetical protein
MVYAVNTWFLTKTFLDQSYKTIANLLLAISNWHHLMKIYSLSPKNKSISRVGQIYL